MKIGRELLKGSTNLIVLSLLEKENMYGYQMIKELREKSQDEKRLISSYWNMVKSKKRKYYSITKEGKKHLKERKEEWEIFSRGINQVLGGVLFGY